TFPIREQAVKGKSWNYELKAVYTVGILNFTFDNSNNDYYHHEVRLVDIATQEVFYDKLTLIYLEMPKFNKTEYELENMFDKWMFVLRNLSRLMERPAALQERIFTRLFETAEIARFNRKELVEYEDSLKNYRDWYSVMETSEKKGLAKGLEKGREEGLAEGLEKGLAEGREKGREEGREEGILEVARKMKSNSIPLHTIQELTGLSLEEIEKLNP
ncbi:Rpn family recombination-promoting nuclease/putative transposase, partial [Bacteroides sp. 519]|uniref:Rpn family recombination-promoting nuclease/putative transposase n=1 Tax=Bacteroides sp. 519 TaxID=2302937 RepID=UPI001EF166FA